MTEYTFEPAHKDMGRHIASGILNSGAVQIVKVACQFASVIVLSRLLPPSDFGLIAMVSPIYGLVLMFQDLGLSQATIQKPALGHKEVNAFFWLNIAAGALLAALICGLSPVIGWYYNEPRVVALSCAIGALVLIGSTINQPCAIMTRRMEFTLMSFFGGLEAVISLSVSIVTAMILKSYWALFWGMAAGKLVAVIGIWFAVRWKPSWPRRVSGIGSMLKFGAGVTSSNLTSYFSSNMDNILIGWKWGGETLGFYDRAYKLLLFPITRIVGPVMGTLVPVLSRLNDEPERYRGIFLITMGQLTLITWPGIVWAIVLSQTLIPTLLGPKWAPSAEIFVPLAIAGLVQTVNNAMGYLYTSQGRSGDLARWSFIGAVIDVASFVFGLPFGAVGVATAYAISEYARTPVLWWAVTRQGPIRARDVANAVAPQIAAATISLFALFAYQRYVQTAPIILLVGGLLLSYGIMLIVMAASRRGREILSQTLMAGQKLLTHVRLS